jgi:WD40 repeat protein
VSVSFGDGSAMQNYSVLPKQVINITYTYLTGGIFNITGSGVVNSYNLSVLVLTPLNTMTAHTSYTNAIVRINQKQMATIASDTDMRIWDIASGTVVNTYTSAHVGGGNAIVILPGGLLATGGFDSTIKVWNMVAQTVNTFNVENQVLAMKLNSVTGYLVAMFKLGSSSFATFDPISLTQVTQFGTNNYNDFDILLPSGKVIAGGAISQPAFLDIFNVDGTVSFSYSYALSSIIKVKVLPDQVTVVLGLLNGQLALFNSLTNTFGATYSAHSNWVELLSLTPDGLVFISGGLDSQVVLWTWNTMNLTQVNQFNISAQIDSNAFITPNFTDSETFTIKYIL